MSYKDAAQSAGITPETLCRWLARGKVESGLFHEFYESVQEALVHFELVHLENIDRSALEETKIIRQTVKYKGGEILNGPVERREGQVRYDRVEVSPAELRGFDVAARAAVPREVGATSKRSSSRRKGSR